jgi:hypothetical protein
LHAQAGLETFCSFKDLQRSAIHFLLTRTFPREIAINAMEAITTAQQFAASC